MALTKIKKQLIDLLSPPLATTSGGTGLAGPGAEGNVLTSDGTTWISNPLPLVGIGINQTWQTPSRAAGTTYTNSTGKPIQVLICVNPSTSPNILVVTVSGVQIYASGSNTWDNSAQAAFIVPNGATYSITTSSSVRTWAELR